jgi:hypothetical protein
MKHYPALEGAEITTASFRNIAVNGDVSDGKAQPCPLY